MRFFYLILIVFLFLGGCRTFEGFSDDVSSVFGGDPDEEKTNVEPIDASEAGIVLDPFYKKKSSGTSFEEELEMRKKKPVKQKVIVMPKCYREEIGSVTSISELYKYFYKKSPECSVKTYEDTADRIYKIVMTNLRKQEIRLLNGDEKFSYFIIGVIRKTNPDLTEVGRNFLIERGCGLLDAGVCEQIKEI